MTETQPLRHMSDTDAFTWYMERDPLLRSTVVVVLVFDHAPDHSRVTARLEHASRVVPGLRHRLAEPPWRLATPVWTVDPDFDISWHVRRIVAAPPATLDRALDRARTEGMGAFDRARPLWTWTTIEGLDDGRAVGVLKIHHSLTDGIGGVELAAQLMDFAADAAELPETATAPVGEALGTIGLLCDAIAFQWRRLVGVTVDVVGVTPRRVGHGLRAPGAAIRDVSRTAASVLRFVRPITDTRSPVMTERRLGWHYSVLDLPLDDMKRAGKAAECSLNDAFLAGILSGLERYHDLHGATPDSLRVTMPISVRAPGDAAGGNHITLMRFDVPVKADSVVERMQAVHDRVLSARHEPAIPLTNTIAQTLNLLPSAVVGSMLKHVDFIASDVPGLDAPFYLGGARVRQVYPFGPTIGAALNVTLLSYCTTCHLGINSDTGAVPDPEVLLGCLRDAFDEVLAAGN